MNALRTWLEELRSEPLRRLADEELEDRLSELARTRRVVEAESARTVAEIERRGSFGVDGHLSVTSFVESRLGVGWSEAAREVRMARALEHMPAAREALGLGEVSSSAIGALAAAREANPEAFSEVEEDLVEVARTMPARGLRLAVERWRVRVEPRAAEREDAERFERRCMHVSRSRDGMVRVDGNLDPETGATLSTALDAVTGAWVRSRHDDPRSPAQRRADALGEVCRGWLSHSDRPIVGGERPHITVVADLETLEGRSPGRSETSVGTPVPAETVRRLACDAQVSRVITSGRSEPLDVGRTVRVVPPSLRRALSVRDQGCAFPTCDRPVSWCDAHHVRHWVDGGQTELSNLVLLCRRHHRMTHSGFRVQMIEGRPWFRRPDGSVIEDRASP
ncbi:MAG TPA: DUF222 domain-containing protein [Actinomycetota bacterium]